MIGTIASEIYLPEQVVPLPLKPVLQVQILEPIVFLHSAFLSHPPFPFWHSFISGKKITVTVTATFTTIQKS